MNPFKITSLLPLALAAALAGCAQQAAAPGTVNAAGAAQIAAASVTRQAPAEGLYEIAYSTKQDAVFVASAGGRGEDAAPAKIQRLHPESLAVQAEILLDRKGYGLKLDDAANRLYIGNTNDASITVVDTTTNKVIGIVQLAEKIKAPGPDGKEAERYPHSFREMAVDSANHRLYAPGLWFQESALYIVDTRTLKTEKVLPGFGFVATGVTLDAKAGKLFVSNLQGQFFTVDTSTLAVTKAEAGGDQLLNLEFDQGARRVLATDQGLENIDGMRTKLGKLENYSQRSKGNRVVVLDPANGKLLASMPTGAGPVALLLDEPRDRLYVTNRVAGTLSVFNSRSHALLQTIPVPTHPNSLALDARRNVLYVTIKNGEKDPKGAKESVARIKL
ncbi:YncE family protein [Ottowia thiooxydans]|uniref:YncE family protein n=1 Tax=Ottowia thiooxydans TaxID=219182 RepID=UPI0004056966|nr:YncE family protein [Ottowia thiooxydans]